MLGDYPRAAVLALLGDEERAESIANDVHALVRAGDADAGDSTDDASWAIRRLLEALAHERPLVLLVDDIHWAEPSLLDLVEYVSSFSTGAPLLLLANARPDLLEEHPTWATPRENANVIVLQPLSEGESAELAAHLGDDPARRRSDREAGGCGRRKPALPRAARRAQRRLLG